MKNIFIASGVAVLLLIGGVWWSKSLQSNNPNVISTKGIHWHPKVEIFAKGEKQIIPANLGIGAKHQPMHTHDSSGTIHLEFQDLVRQEDVRLGRFFEIWGKNFMDFGSSINMTVNGKENAELENYPMKDGDKIELKYQ